MRVSADMCRKQQAIQSEIAESDPLENRRDIAKAAAKAWGKEALDADKRAAREQKRRAELSKAEELAKMSDLQEDGDI
jgi:hypothetical protein